MNAGDKDYTGATIYVLRGLPRAGKSTLAASLNGVVVSKDSIRLSLHGQPFVDWQEPEVHDVYKLMVSALLYSGHRIIILDDCFLTRASVDAVRQEWPMATVVEHIVPTPPATCIERAIACDQAYLVPVIKDMAQSAEWLQ